MLDMVHSLAKLPQVKISYWGPSGPLPDSVINICTKDESNWLDKLLAGGGIAARLRDKKLSSLFVAGKLLILLGKAYRRVPDADLLHINWLQNALPLLFTPKPALITALGSDLSLLNNRLIAFAFRLSISRNRTIITPNADWMIQSLKDRVDSHTRIIPVYFGVSDIWLKMRRRSLNDNKKKWLVVLRITKQKIGKLFDWAKHIDDTGDELHLFGPMQEKLDIPAWVHYHGPCHPQQLADNWFPGASGLITLSEHDEGRPQIILDAMAAGLPVIASGLPAHTDLINNNKTGYIVQNRPEFISACNSLRNPEVNRSIGDNAKAYIQGVIGDWNACARRYVELYNQLLNSE